MGQRGVTVWFTGLSGAGKTTICQAVEQALRAQGYLLEVLDGDLVRENLTKGLGFSLLTRNGVIVLVSAISPYREVREQVKQKIGDFVEVYVSTPLEVCEQRDVKGLYKRARAGQIKQFTGIDDPYEPPLNPEVNCETQQETVEQSAQHVLDCLKSLGYLDQVPVLQQA